MSVFAPPRIIMFPPISIALNGVVRAAIDGEPPDCPTCGAELDLSQPAAEDSDQLVGHCVECHRLALVLATEDSRRFALALPSREEALAEVLALLRQ